MKKSLLALFIFPLISNAIASPIVAVLDTGFDINHEFFEGKIFVNDLEKNGEKEIDDDQNGLIDDVNGWNFQYNSNLVLDRTFINALNHDIKMFASHRGQSISHSLGGLTPDRFVRKWYEDRALEMTKIELEYASFASYAHGTHVAGIIARDNDLTILPLKFLKGMKNEKFGDHKAKADPANVSDKFIAPFNYAAQSGAKVVNLSLGHSYKQQYDSCMRWVKDPAHCEPFAIKKINPYVDRATEIFSNYPEMLFVIAAGNDGLNNDYYPTSPANAEGDNVITVGASWGANKIAPFSNYGENSVDLFAHGVNVRSSVPSPYGDQMISMSGTSQAAPQVSRVAGEILNIASDLDGANVKRIILETVDVKYWLQDYCRTSGILNGERAIYAAKLYRDGLSIDEAIVKAREAVKDVKPFFEKKVIKNKFNTKSLLVTPLPTF